MFGIFFYDFVYTSPCVTIFKAFSRTFNATCCQYVICCLGSFANFDQFVKIFRMDFSLTNKIFQKSQDSEQLISKIFTNLVFFQRNRLNIKMSKQSLSQRSFYGFQGFFGGKYQGISKNIRKKFLILLGVAFLKTFSTSYIDNKLY